MKGLFFDTYALIEVIKGNPRYKQYLKGKIITTKINLLELYFILLKTHNPQIADKHYDLFKEATLEISHASIKAAAKIKLSFKEKNLSYADCIGYAVALETNSKFLTGDKEFEDMPRVEFVK